MLEEAIDTRPFRFSAILDEAYQDILPTLLELEDRLNEDIQLADYTDAIETIYFTPMILEDQTEYEERLEYDWEGKEVFLQVFVDKEDFDLLSCLKHYLLILFEEAEQLEQIALLIENLRPKEDVD